MFKILLNKLNGFSIKKGEFESVLEEFFPDYLIQRREEDKKTNSYILREGRENVGGFHLFFKNGKTILLINGKYSENLYRKLEEIKEGYLEIKEYKT